MQPELNINLLKKHWPAEEPAFGLATRISARATSLPQWRPWHLRIADFFSQWDYAPAYKSAVFAAIAALGLYAGQFNLPAADDELDFNSLMAVDTSFTEGL